MHSHNSGYKRLFSNRTRFRDLVQTFVEVDRFMAVWVGHYLLSFCLDYRSGAASVKWLCILFG